MGAKHTESVNKLVKLGWKVWASPAITGLSGRAAGGAPIASTRGLDVSDPKDIIHGRATRWTLRTAALGTIAIYSIYLIAGIQLHVNNRQIFASIMAYIHAHQPPFILPGDLGMSPEIIAAAPWKYFK